MAWRLCVFFAFGAGIGKARVEFYTFLVDGLNPQIPFFLEPWASDIIREHEDLRRKFGME